MRGISSPVTAIVLVNGKGQITRYRIHAPQLIAKIVTGDYVGDPYADSKFGANPLTGACVRLWRFLYLFIFFFSELTYRSEPFMDFQT